MKKCAFCAEDIQDAAVVCKHCGRDTASGAVRVTPVTGLGTKALAVVFAVLFLWALYQATCGPLR
jgi:hypothetical protein